VDSKLLAVLAVSSAFFQLRLSVGRDEGEEASVLFAVDRTGTVRGSPTHLLGHTRHHRAKFI